MADGSELAVERFGDYESVLNPVTGRAARVARITAGEEKHDLVVIDTGTSRVQLTEGHPVPTARGIVQASALRPDDELTVDGGKQVKIRRLTREAPAPGLLVYNIEIEGGASADEHMIVANGLVVGDLWLQEQLAGGKKP
jgi:hypothetical protein